MFIPIKTTSTPSKLYPLFVTKPVNLCIWHMRIKNHIPIPLPPLQTLIYNTWDFLAVYHGNLSVKTSPYSEFYFSCLVYFVLYIYIYSYRKHSFPKCNLEFIFISFKSRIVKIHGRLVHFSYILKCLIYIRMLKKSILKYLVAMMGLVRVKF